MLIETLRELLIKSIHSIFDIFDSKCLEFILLKMLNYTHKKCSKWKNQTS